MPRKKRKVSSAKTKASSSSSSSSLSSLSGERSKAPSRLGTLMVLGLSQLVRIDDSTPAHDITLLAGDGAAVPGAAVEVEATVEGGGARLVLRQVKQVVDKEACITAAEKARREHRRHEIERREQDIATLKSESEQLSIKAGEDPDDKEATRAVLDNIYLQGMHRKKIRELKAPGELAVSYTRRTLREEVVLQDGVVTRVPGLEQWAVWSTREEEAEAKVGEEVEDLEVVVPFRLEEPGALLAIGGEDEEHNILGGMCRLDCADRTWSASPHAGRALTSLGAAAVGSTVYVVGGIVDEEGTVARVEALDVGTGEWTVKQPMGQARIGHGVAAIEGLVYAVGGYGDEGTLSSAEVYDPQLDQWTNLPPMSTERAGVAVCALNGLLYACGGEDAADTELSSVEVFNPALAAWSAVAPMPAARYSACAAALGGRVYVCGGYPFTEMMVSYDPAADVWREEPSMHYMRYDHAVASVDGLLYVSGGYGKLAGSDDYSAALSSAEVFDPATGVWTLLPAMPEARRRHALVHAEKA